MHRSRSFVALAVLAALLLVPVKGAHAAASAGESTMAREIAEDINNERAARGLPRIPYDSEYSVGAQRVAEQNRDTPCHACHSTDHPSGEVVWWGSNYPSSGSPLWWMGSPSHRNLMMVSSATRLGVGVACNGTEHDAVAWIETTADIPTAPPKPVVTKEGTGSRCAGGGTTATTRAGAVIAVTTTRPGSPATTGATLVAGAATPRAVTTTTATRGRTATTNGGSVIETAAKTPAVQTAAAPFVDVQAAASGRFVSASRPLAGSRGIGPLGTALLLLTFLAVIAVGRITHRSGPPHRDVAAFQRDGAGQVTDL